VTDAAALARREFLAICEEAGSSIVHEGSEGSRALRRVVQVVTTRDTETFPRAVTSEPGKRSAQDALRRGDALLYAAPGDGFEPGDLVRWRGAAWRVLGSLGAEMLGDIALYEEVGLRRLPTRAQCRAQGRIEGPE
jgi:hypothetical protein